MTTIFALQYIFYKKHSSKGIKPEHFVEKLLKFKFLAYLRNIL